MPENRKQDEIRVITIDGVEYVRKDTVVQDLPKGMRCVVVVDRGWIYAGDVEDRDGRIYLTRAVHVFGWKSVGFVGMLKEPKKHDIRPVNRVVDIPKESEIYRVHVEDDWGL